MEPDGGGGGNVFAGGAELLTAQQAPAGVDDFLDVMGTLETFKSL